MYIPLFRRRQPPTATELPETRAFSRQLIAYIAAFLPVAPFFKANDSRIAGICDNQYTATLDTLKETQDDAFTTYLTRKTQGWFRRWGRAVAGAASLAPGAAPTAPDGAGAGAGAATPARASAPGPSDDEGSGDIITPDATDAAPSPT